MPENVLLQPVELTDAELDLVTGGHSIVKGGLVNVALSDVNVEILTDKGLVVNVDDSIKDIAILNDLNVGAVIQLLGGPTVIRQRQI